MASLLAQLPGPINLRLVLSDLKLTDILHDLVTAKGNRSGVPRVLAVDRNETRELAGTLHLEAPGVPVYSYTDNIIPAMTSATTPSGVVTKSGGFYAEWLAFDHVNPAVEVGAWLAGFAVPSWLQYQFPSVHVITRYAITSRNESSHPSPPKSWHFQGSNDGSAWDTLDTQTDITDWATSPNVRKIFDFTNATAYLYYRVDITASNDAVFISVGELEMMTTVVSHSSGKDDAIAQIRAINALVTVGTTLTLQSTGATNAVTLKVLPSRGVSQPLDELFELPGGPVLASCPFSFTCEPYAYGPETTVYENSGAVLPNVIDIDVPGDYPTPLKVSFDQIASGAVHAMYIGMLPDQATPLSSLLRPASSAHYGECWVDIGGPPMVYTALPHKLTSGQTVEFFDSACVPSLDGDPYFCSVVDDRRFTIPGYVSAGGTATLTYFTSSTGRVGVIEDVNCFSGWNRNYASLGEYAGWEVDDRSMPPGTYLPLVRTKQAGAGMNNVVLSSATTAAGGSGFQGSDATYALNPLSKMLHLPYYRMPDPAATWKTPKLWWIPSGGTPTLYMDYLALMPTTWGWAFYHDPYPAGGTANFVLGYNGIVYKDLVATPDGRSSGMLAVGASRLFMVAAERQDAAHASAVTGRLIIWAVPRYALWR